MCDKQISSLLLRMLRQLSRYVYVASIGLFVIISFHPYRPVAPVYQVEGNK